VNPSIRARDASGKVTKRPIVPSDKPTGARHTDDPQRSVQSITGLAGFEGGRVTGIMLQRAENVSVFLQRGLYSLLTGTGRLTLVVGRKQFLVERCPKQRFAWLLQQSLATPVCFGGVGERSYWRFRDRWYWDNEDLTENQVYALIVTRDQRRQASISRAQSTVAMTQTPTPRMRGAIPEDLKQLVWTRDQGRCRQCGSNVELQFDHIIPVALGGATTAENLQVLCGPCNRRKGASVASPVCPTANEALPTAGWDSDPTGEARQR
jgi:5-methylcytosine-specific restriction endonuclease McrA